MNSKKLACSFVALGMLAGCGGEPTYTFEPWDPLCTGEAPPASCPDRTVVLPEGGDPVTYTYVVADMSLPMATPEGVAAGFNVDGIDSMGGSTASDANCQEFNPDFTSPTDPDVGIDNALQGLVGLIEGLLDAADCPGGTTEGCLDATLQEQIDTGSLILLLEVADVNDLTYDSDVTVTLALGEVPGGGAPMIDGTGALAAGQAFDRVMDLATVPGDIFNGRARMQTDLLPLSIPAGGVDLTLNISQAELRFDITADGLTRGNLGGVIQIQALVDAVEAAMPGFGETVRSVLEPVADVGPLDADPAICESMSVGFLLGGTTATIN